MVCTRSASKAHAFGSVSTSTLTVEKTEDQIEANEAYAIERFNVLRAAGFNPLLESNKRGGYHIWIFFSKTVSSEVAYRVGLALLATWSGDEKETPEQFPKRADRHTAGGYGGG